MNISQLIILVLSLVSIFSCKQISENENSNFEYFDKSFSKTSPMDILIAVSDEEFLQFGSRVAYLNKNGDTIIPFDKYAYLGTDTLIHFANVIEFSENRSYGRWIAIDGNQNTLYEIVSFDNGPDYFQEGLVRVKRNGKMGFANQNGQVIIPCKYDFACRFEDGQAKVTYDAREIRDKYDDHTKIKSDEWFYIDKKGSQKK